MTTSIPEELGPFQIKSVLGRGGMGMVYLATQRGLDRPVALKVMRPGLSDDPGFATRFSREATILARLDSPHIIAIYDHGQVGEVLYLATQYVAGGDLSALITRQGALSRERALALFGQILRGLRDAHRVGVIHRDIKPANILLRAEQSEPHVYLCDFGIAQAGDGDQHTRAGLVAGSAAFMAPERFAGLPATVQSDLYSAACVLWVMLSGRNLYSGTEFQVATQHASGPIPQLNGTDPLSETINLVFRSCLAKDPLQRPRSAEDVLGILEGTAVPGRLEEPGPVTTLRPAPAAAETWMDATVRRDPPTVPPEPLPSTTPVAAGPIRPRRTVLIAGVAAGVVATLFLGGFAITQLLGGQRTAAAPVQPRSPVPATSSVATGSPSAPATSAEAETYTCWDGTHSADLNDCGTPAGNVGLLHVFPSLADDRDRCELDSPLIERRPGTTSYRCQYADGFVLYRYWADGSDAGAHFERSYVGQPARTDLVLDGKVVGYRYLGRLGNGDYAATAALLNSHFTVSVASPVSARIRDHLFAGLRFRSFDHLNGYPSAEEPGVAARG